MTDRTPLPGHKHPSATAWRKGCRCEPCRTLRRRTDKLRDIYGSKWRDVGPAAAHLRSFHKEGFSLAALGAGAGVAVGTPQRILNGERRWLHVRVYNLIMAVTRETLLANAPDKALVPSIGATRRLQALARMGWRPMDLAATQSEVHTFRSIRLGRDQQAKAATHRRVCEMYAKHSMDIGPAEKSTVTRIINLGYAPPLAWDDIDDPMEQPNLTGEPAGGRMDLYLSGLSDAAIAREEHVTVDAIRVWRRRNGLAADYKTRGRHVA